MSEQKGKGLSSSKEVIDYLHSDEQDELLLTDVNGKDTQKAIDDLEKHKLPSLFSYRQAYFVGTEAQLAKVLKHCNHLVAEKTGICLHCGEKVTKPKPEKHRLDRPRLRAFAKDYFLKIDNMPSDAWDRLPGRTMTEHLEKMSKILALIPDIEEAVAAKSIIFAQASEKAALDLKARWQEEAKKQERERITNKLLGMFAYPEMVIPMNADLLLQALK